MAESAKGEQRFTRNRKQNPTVRVLMQSEPKGSNINLDEGE